MSRLAGEPTYDGVAASSMRTQELGVGQRGGPYPMFTMGILATVSMLFAAFSAAVLVRRMGTDWIHLSLPAIVWVNTALLVASSAAVERARALVRGGATQRSIPLLGLAFVLGILFLAGQVVAWRSLAARGIFLPTNPHAAFFYLLTGVHGAHVLGGLVVLAWTTRRAKSGAYTSAHSAGLTHAAIYWHFVGGVWLYLLALLSIS